MLLVEDDSIAALDARGSLERRGAEVVGPFSDVASARAVRPESIDAALLDIRVANGTTSELAADLVASGIAVVFVSGCRCPAPSSLPPVGNVIRFVKPVSYDRVALELERLLEDR